MPKVFVRKYPKLPSDWVVYNQWWIEMDAFADWESAYQYAARHAYA